MALSAKAEITQMKASGNFFTKDVSKTIMANTLDMVEWLVGQGERLYRAGVPTDTGFTQSHIHGFAYQRTQLVTGAKVQSRFGKIRLGKRGETVSRPVTAGTNMKRWGPKRRPYVTLQVLEKRHHARRKAFNRLRAYERNIRRDLAKGLH